VRNADPIAEVAPRQECLGDLTDGIDQALDIPFARSVPVKPSGCGARVIAADADALPYLVRDGINGFRYAPDQTEQLTRQLGTLLGNPELRQQMGVAS